MQRSGHAIFLKEEAALQQKRDSPRKAPHGTMRHPASIRTALCIAAAAIGLVSCGGSKQNRAAGGAQDTEHALSIVTTMFPHYDFARAVGGSKVALHMLLKPGAEAHSYEPSPEDIKRIQKADVFLYTGAENDVWAEDILASLQGRHPDTLRLLDCVTAKEEELVEGMQPEAAGEEEADESEYDEHVWTSPRNAIQIVRRITDIYCAKDAENAEYYRVNCDAYCAQLEQLDSAFRQTVAAGSRRTIVFGDRFPFRYFADEYGLSYFAAFPGCATDVEVNAQTMKFLINKVRQENIPVVFSIELSNGKIADAICEATGAERQTLYSCHNLTAQEFSAGESYVSFMQKNVEALKKALD